MSSEHDPRLTPSSEQTAQMASDMLHSAVTQKNAIGESFLNQRSEILKAIAARKSTDLGQLKDSAPNTAVPPVPGASAPPQAEPEIAEHAKVPPATPAELAALQTLTPHNANAGQPDTVAVEIVLHLRALIAKEITQQLADLRARPG